MGEVIKCEDPRPDNDFPLGPRHDGAEDLCQRDLERYDAYRPFLPDSPSLFSRFTPRFPFAFEVLWWTSGGGRGVLLIATLFGPRYTSPASVNPSCRASVTGVSSRYARFVLDASSTVHAFLRSSALPLRPPDERFRSPHRPRLQGAILATRSRPG
jgi:hypothetical protein